MNTANLISPITQEGRVPVETVPSRDNAALSAFGLPVVVFDGLQKQYRHNQASITSEFDHTLTGTASVSLANNCALQLNTGASASSSALSLSKNLHQYTSGKGLKIMMSVVLGDSGVAGNQREWGYGDLINGVSILLDGGEYKFVLRSGGMVVALIAASAWQVPVLPDPNGHLWYIQFEWLGVGDFWVYYDQKPVLYYNYLGTSTAPSMESPDLPIFFRNENTSNTSDVFLKNVCSAVSSEGRNIVEVFDQNGTGLNFSADNRVRTEAFGTTLVSDNFADDIFDNVITWFETIVGGASYSVNESVLSLAVTTGATDLIEEFYNSEARETIGATCSYNVKYRFGTDLEANNVREWGYLDDSKLNGAFFRLNGAVFSIVFKKSGVETLFDITLNLPTAEFHKYTITQNGLDDFNFYIDDKRVFRSKGTALVGNKNKSPFFKNYNLGVLGSVPSASQVSWFNLLDSAGRSTIVIGRTSSNQTSEIRLDNAGRLLTSQETPPAGPGEESVSRTIRGNLSGISDNEYLIPTGKTLQIRSMIGGVENTGAGNSFTLFEDPNGDKSVLNVVPLGEIIIDGGTQQNTFATDYQGDGTRRIVLRTEQLTGGSYRTTTTWSGVIK